MQEKVLYTGESMKEKFFFLNLKEKKCRRKHGIDNGLRNLERENIK